MIIPATIVIIVKSKTSLALLATALINFASAELVKELGTLACQIDNCRLLNKECSYLQRRYELLEQLVKRSK